jgi:hypothetical protein
VYHVDSETREETEIPPYTSPASLFSEKKEEDNTADESSVLSEAKTEDVDLPDSIDDYDEKTFDGYQTIQKANSRASREEELKLMREARIANRSSTSTIDPSKIGVLSSDDLVAKPEETEVASSKEEDLSGIYSTIKANKEAAKSSGLTMQDSADEDRPDPGFRIVHVDSVTREETEIPPYTSPQSVLNKKKANSEPWGE